MRDFSISVDIKASPERVWEVLSDGERWHEWTPSVTSVELLDKSIAVGSRAIIRQPELPPAKFKITALEPGRTTGVVVMRVTVHNQAGELVMEGEHRYLLRRKRPA